MLAEWFKKHIEQTFPEFREDDLFIAVSGGIDSIVLAELMHRLDFNFTVLHCNFKLRAESLEDENFVREWAGQHSQNFLAKSFETLTYAEEHKLSIQMAARELRFRWFESVIENKEKTSLLLAHHQNDQIETFLINLSRSSGIKGLSGIDAKRGIYKRPLLPFQKDDILEFAKRHQIDWREDKSNQKNDYLRNHMRNEVIPKLNTKVPYIYSGITNSMAHLRDISDFIDSEVADFMKKYASIENNRTIIETGEVTQTNSIILRQTLVDYGFRNEQCHKIIQALNSPGREFESHSHTCIVDRNRLLLYPLGFQENKTSKLTIPTKDGHYNFNGYKISLRLHSVVDWTVIRNSPKHTAHFDFDKLNEKLTFRYWQKGDKMKTLGMKGRKKLSDLFIDEKIPVSDKDNTPLVCDSEEIIWCYGLRQSSHAAITESTSKVLEIKILD